MVAVSLGPLNKRLCSLHTYRSNQNRSAAGAGASGCVSAAKHLRQEASGNEAPPGGTNFCHVTLTIFIMMEGIF